MFRARGWTRDELALRELWLLPGEKKARASRWVLDNDGDREAFLRQGRDLGRQLRRLASVVEGDVACGSPEEADRMARELCALNRERQNVEQTIYSQAEEMIAHMPERERSALVLESSRWHQGVVGIVASRLSEKYSRPSFMIHLNGTTGKGSCRSWGGFNLFAALENCKDLLLGFGGHELAAGLTIDESNIPAFRERMNDYARSFRGGEAPVSVLDVDVAITHPSFRGP